MPRNSNIGFLVDDAEYAYANNFLGRRGTIWQAGYHDRAVRSDEHLAVVARYIAANPVTAGIVARVGDYPLWDAVWL